MNNEEKILELLEKQGAMLEKQGEVLAEHSAMLAKQGEMLAKHDEMLAEMKAAQEEMRADISEMQTTLTRVAVTQEGTVLPRLQLLYEGHSAIMDHMDTLTPKRQTEALEDEVTALRDSHKLLRQDVNELKKAQ